MENRGFFRYFRLFHPLRATDPVRLRPMNCCPHCGHHNPAANRFCGQCGGALAAAPATAALPIASAAVPSPVETAAPVEAAADDTVAEGRRQVTILFCDLSGFTDLSTKLDAEDLHELVQAYFDRAEQIITALGGSLERYIGDAVMAVFGARRAHDDDALRAVRAGLDIHAAMPALSQRFGMPLTSVVGIATGEVVVKAPRPGYAAEVAVVGVSVNLAARIESLGAPGELLISDEVHAQVDSRVVAHSLGLKARMGLDRPVEVFRVDGLTDDRAAVLPRTRFVGRDAELLRLREMLAAIGRSRQSATALVRGEAGIGKTRLLGELLAMARDAAWLTHSARFLDFGLRRGAEGLQALACGLLGLDPVTATGDERRRAADDAIDRGEVSPQRLPLLYELLSADHTARSRTAFDAMNGAQRERHRRGAMAELVTATASRSPLLLVLEDTHWADDLEMDRLAALAAACADLPVLIALGTRPTDARAEPAWRTAAAEMVAIDLEALDAGTLAELAAGLVDLAPAALDSCITRSGGNPLFLEQLVRHVAESGLATVPASIRSLLLARMDLLPRRDRETLQIASVLGQRFEPEALRALMLDAPRDDFGDLLGAQMLIQEGPDLVFAHALIHEAAYASLLRRSARDLHGLAATWYAGRDALLRARHLDRADSPDAVTAYRDCAEADLAAGRHAAARAALDRGLAIATAAADRVELTLCLGRLQHDIGQIPDSIATHRRAIADAIDDGQRARGWIGLAAGMRLSDDLDGAAAALDRAQPLARGRDADLTRLHYLRGSLAFPRGDIAGCRHEHGLALQHARAAGLRAAEAEAWSGLGDAAYASGRMRSAHEAFAACMALCQEIGLGRVEAANRFMVATVRIYLNQFDGALTDALESADLARRVGHQRAEIVSCLTAGWILILLGRLDEARVQTDTGLRVAEALGAARFKPFLMESRARIELAAGDADAALATIREALALTRDGKLMRFIGPWLLATLALCTRDAAQRDQALAEGRELLAEGCVGHNLLNFHALAIESAADWDDAATLDASALALADYTAEEPHPWADFQIARAKALSTAIRVMAGPSAGARLDAMAALQGLCDQARDLGWRAALPAMLRSLDRLARR
jgi:class 3 adenylate cyclase/tetratricopeptide (TPR) repeat protein